MIGTARKSKHPPRTWLYLIVLAVGLPCILASIFFVIIGNIMRPQSIPTTVPILQPTVVYPAPLAIISSSNSEQLKEMAILPAETNDAAVTALAFTSDNTHLVVFQSSSGNLSTWSLRTQSLSATFHLESSLEQGTALAQDSSKLLVATQMKYGRTGLPARNRPLFGNVHVWDLSSESDIGCVSGCTTNLTPNTVAIAINPAATWLIEASGYSLISTALNTPRPSGSIYRLPAIDNDPWDLDISRIAFSATGEFLAVGFAEGETWVYGFSENGVGPRVRVYGVFSSIVNGTNFSKETELVDLAFDGSMKWLAEASAGQVRLWALKESANVPARTIDIQGIKCMAFDQVGNLLFVGTSTGLEVWDLNTATLTKLDNKQSVSTILVSSDNRLLVWGDSQGIVHIWGVPISP